MEACALQNLGETFEYQQIHNTDLEVEQIKREGTDEMLYNSDSRRDSTGVEYDMQLMAMEEEMRRNAEEIAKTGDEVLNNNEITGVDEDTAAEDVFPGAMAPILEEEEEETESGSFCEHGTDNNVVTSPDASPAATTHQTDTSVEATSSGDKDNSCTTTNTTCATRDDALEVAAKQNSANKSLNIVVTKADVHAENTDGAQRVGGADCVTSCSQSLGNGVCYSAGACRHNNGGGDGSDGDCVVSGEHSLQTVKTENTEQTVDKPTGEMGQCASVAADNIDKETNYVAENTSNAVKPEQNKGSGLTDLHGSTQNESNTSQPQSGHASVISVTPARDVEKSDVAKLSESKTAEFPQVDTALKETEKTENSKAGTKTQADTSKSPPSSFEFYGVRPKESTPTACSITARMRCLHTGSHTGDKLAVVEDGDTCDLEIFVKVLEGLALGKTKIYIKICLESEEPNYKRIKRKTKAMKCASPLQLSKRIVLPNMRRKILTQGRLVVAIWSKSALGTNTPVCKCDLDMARQHKFFEGKGGVMTFAQKLATDKKVWNNVTLYLS
uniref:Uncharacterized protein LOC100180710 n=1 Tax=Phallusia mammillata TaxID=59560 RepID=A0A6F9DI17_9ASCI|nr:uncharacterized protein LOC100180710 [Phallusia mammillata]